MNRSALALAGLFASLSILACGAGQRAGGAPAGDAARGGPVRCSQAGRSYFSRDVHACRVSLFSCAQGTSFFDEACGCGCRRP